MPKIIYFDEHEELSDDNLVVFFEPCNNKASDSKTQDNTKAVDLLKELVEDAISPLKLYGMPDKDEAPKYRDSQKGMIDDIREISGYARDEKILSQLYGNDIPNQVPACLIVVPEETKVDDEDDPTCNVFDFSSQHTLLSKAKKIKGFTNFYKICIPVPSL